MTRIALVVLVLAAAWPARIAAQSSTGVPAVDSAAAARAAWGRGVQALHAGDMRTARDEVRRASRAWPTQEAYAWGRVVVEARAADTAGFADALRELVARGFGEELGADSLVRHLAAAPALAELVAANDANRAPIARGRTIASAGDSTFWPEGVDYDATTGRYYLASVRYGTIAELDASGHWRELLPRHAHGISAILGVRVDSRRGVLWATTSGIPQTAGYQLADSAIGALLEIQIADGAIQRQWDVAAVPGGHVFGDLAVAANGDVYFTDSVHPDLYRLRAGADTLERLTHPLFRSLQGMAPAPDGRTVYVSDYSHGLLRVDFAAGAVRRLDDAPGSTSLGCDGIEFDHGAIVAVQNGLRQPRIARFDLDDSGNRIVRVEVLDRNLALAQEPTIGTVVGDRFVYVADSQWDEHDDNGALRAGAKLAGPRLVAVSIRP